MIRKIVIISILVLLGCKSNQFTDQFGSEDNSYEQLKLYFSNPPANRPAFFYDYTTNPPDRVPLNDTAVTTDFITVQVGFEILSDLGVLSEHRSNSFYKSLQWSGEIFAWKNDSLFKQDVYYWERAISNKGYLKKANGNPVPPKKIKGNMLRYVDAYAKNTIYNRIYYIEKYSKKVPIEVLNLFKIDLDNILEVDTPNFLIGDEVDATAFEEAKSIWKSKLQD